VNAANTSGHKNRTFKKLQCLHKEQMEALIINSILVGVSLYSLKDFYTKFKELSKRVDQLDENVRIVSDELQSRKEDFSF
jgi:hypothetical protein